MLIAFEKLEQVVEHRGASLRTAGKQKAPTGPTFGSIRVLPGERGLVSR
jgi:hypothetical protein